MVMERDQIIEILNDLYETVRDGADGYRQAAQNTDNAEYKTFFQSIADQRTQFDTELQTAVLQLNGDPEQSGSLAAKAHRTFIDAKAAVTGHDLPAILEECRRGDERAIEHYQKVLDNNSELPIDIHGLLSNQYRAIQETYSRLKLLAETVSSK